MIPNKQTAMYQWLTEQTAAKNALHAQLLKDDRSDEAAFAKIQGNIYGIFCSVLEAAGRACSGEDAVRDFFLQRLEQIPSHWQQALLQAQAHGNEAQAHIEALKLEAVEAVKAMFRTLWEEEL